MVFKAVAGVDKNVYDTYNSHGTSSEDVMSALDVTNKHHDHYKNRIVSKWRDFNPSEVVYNNWDSRKMPPILRELEQRERRRRRQRQRDVQKRQEG